VRVTLRDIAKATGFSITTVSRALNDYNDVSPSTKELVRRTAKEMGYSPNTLAQRLRKKRTDTIGLILPTFGPRFSDPFFSELLAGIGNRAAQHGYDLLVSTRPPGEMEMASYRRKVQGRRVDGFIVVRTRRHDPRIEYLRQAHFPFVAFGRTEEGADYPFVDEDGYRGMSLVAQHLVGLGHRRIACITPPPELMFTRHRLAGFRDSMAEHGIAVNESLIVESDLTQRGGYEQANRLLALRPPPTAIAACNDLMAFGAMSAIQDHGLVVGQDISVTGFDNTPMAEHSFPPLTTIHQPIYQIGGMICEMLVQIIQDKPLERSHVLLQPKLIVRHSSGPAPTKGGDAK
jgi:LacI family transcriptional regulator